MFKIIVTHFAKKDQKIVKRLKRNLGEIKHLTKFWDNLN